jgi:hypothetical protein
MQLSFLELATFQVALHHSLVEFLAEFIKEIGAAVILATLHVHIDVVTVLDFHTEDFRKGVSQFLYANLSVVDTITGVKGIKEFD